MKALVFSDLHLQHADLDYYLDLPDDAEVAIVAGDVSAPISGSMRWLHKNIVSAGIPVVFVAGNHESYSFAIDETIPDGRSARAKFPEVNFLENETVVIGGVRFVGFTLWTDFGLYGHPDDAMHVARQIMNDFRLIYWVDDERNGGFFSPQDSLEIHMQSRAWVETELSKPFDGKTVVVTHHAPLALSVHPRFKGQSLTPAFASDLSDMIDRYQPDVWVHGHVHDNFDYLFGKTRIICNPRGYVRNLFSGKTVENPAFEPFKMIDI